MKNKKNNAIFSKYVSSYGVQTNAVRKEEIEDYNYYNYQEETYEYVQEPIADEEIYIEPEQQEASSTLAEFLTRTMAMLMLIVVFAGAIVVVNRYAKIAENNKYIETLEQENNDKLVRIDELSILLSSSNIGINEDYAIMLKEEMGYADEGRILYVELEKPIVLLND